MYEFRDRVRLGADESITSLTDKRRAGPISCQLQTRDTLVITSVNPLIIPVLKKTFSPKGEAVNAIQSSL